MGRDHCTSEVNTTNNAALQMKKPNGRDSADFPSANILFPLLRKIRVTKNVLYIYIAMPYLVSRERAPMLYRAAEMLVVLLQQQQRRRASPPPLS